MASENRITKSRYDEVLWSRVCPGCGDYKVIDTARRSSEDALSPGKFLGAFHQCGGPTGSKCWHMTKYEAKKPNKALYENGRR
jgi:pyruvate/2-oxoacid:ferredoxin oxidoreductase beta subunit